VSKIERCALSGRRPHDSSAIAACAKPLAYDALGASPASVVVEPKSHQPLAARRRRRAGIGPDVVAPRDRRRAGRAPVAGPQREGDDARRGGAVTRGDELTGAPAATNSQEPVMSMDHLSSLPSELLGKILALADLRAFFGCVAAGNALRDDVARLSPKLGRELVMTRFPILGAIYSKSTSPARDLFLNHQAILNAQDEPISLMTPTVALDAYTFVLELEKGRLAPTRWEYESIYVGTGAPRTDGIISFSMPAGLFVQAVEPFYPESNGINFRVRVVVARDGVSGSKHALLARCEVEDWVDGAIHFQQAMIPRTATGKFQARGESHLDSYCDPEVKTTWTSSDAHSTILVEFVWDSDGYADNPMSADDVRLALEHWVRWSSS